MFCKVRPSLFLGSSFRKFLAVLRKELLDGRSSFLGIRAIGPYAKKGAILVYFMLRYSWGE